VRGRLTLPLVLLLGWLPAVALPAAALGGEASTLTTESDNPINDQGSSYHYRSVIDSVRPSFKGLSVQVLEFADRLLLINHTGQTVTVFGYNDEPYARVLANGTAQQNVLAPATYLNTSFYGDVKVPPQANASAPPRWQTLDRTGELEWHDHRIHYLFPSVPPEVKDQSRRTLVFNWNVPIEVGTTHGAILGSLYWTPENSSASVAVIVIGAVIVLAGLGFVLYVRRRRARAGRPPRAGGQGPEPQESW
jgi:hypothetical protein